MKIVSLSAAMLVLASTAVRAQESLPGQLKSTQDKASYSVGVNIGLDLKQAGFDLNLVLKGLQDILADREPLLNEQQRREAIVANVVEKNKTAGAEYAENFKKEQGVRSLPGGVLYQVLKSGAGKSPQANDQVTVHYRGTLVDGRTFDSSYDRGAPTSFGMQDVIDGWTQVLQQMKVGDKWKVVIPPELAYGAEGFPPAIGPHSTLVFEIELLDVQPGAAATRPKSPGRN